MELEVWSDQGHAAEEARFYGRVLKAAVALQVEIVEAAAAAGDSPDVNLHITWRSGVQSSSSSYSSSEANLVSPSLQETHHHSRRLYSTRHLQDFPEHLHCL